MSSYHSGLAGEEQAVAYLKERGLRLVCTRHRSAGGEIDIIAKEGETLCFIEVKHRPQGRLGEGAQAVSQDKRRRMRLAAKDYMNHHDSCATWRYDILEITRAGIWYLKNGARTR